MNVSGRYQEYQTGSEFDRGIKKICFCVFRHQQKTSLTFFRAVRNIFNIVVCCGDLPRAKHCVSMIFKKFDVITWLPINKGLLDNLIFKKIYRNIQLPLYVITLVDQCRPSKCCINIINK
jgi:hypothetical protein